MTAPTLDSTAAAEHFFAGAVAAGLSRAVVSPGSRSTPLTIAADRTPGLEVSVHLDERSAAFAALGEAKATGVPILLVCTSGTAAANYLPAVAEAAMANVPLVVVTADRPPEHQHTGVGQSFDQRGLYGSHVRQETTMPVGGDGGAAFTVNAGWRCVTSALELHGPVHVNWAFRLPLEPTGPSIATPVTPSTPLHPAPLPDERHIDVLVDALDSASHPLIIAGPHTLSGHQGPGEASAIVDGASALGIPVLADVLSGLRGADSRSLIEASALVVDADVPKPDLIIRLGNTPTAKGVRLWWESFEARHLLIDPLDDWQDPSHAMTSRLRCDAPSLITRAAPHASPAPDSWLERWVDAGLETAQHRDTLLDTWPTVTEAHVAHAIERVVGTQDTIVASSSMPVRDLDMFTTAGFTARALSNRGINGIDGVVSTAIGVARSSPGGRTLVHIGDVAALHDVGGILDAARQGVDLTIVVPNNDGGGIFSMLPLKAELHEEQFDRLFHTSHGSTLEFLGAHDGISHEFATDHLVESLARATNRAGVTIVEVPVSTPDRLRLRASLAEVPGR